MARKSSNGGISKSQSIRDLLTQNPNIKATEAVAELKAKGITITPGLFYVTKGKSIGSKKRRRKVAAVATNGAVAIATPKAKSQDAIVVISKVKFVAAEVGGLKSLRAIIEALSE